MELLLFLWHFFVLHYFLINKIPLEAERDVIDRHERLKNLDLYILDNSLRESTVGQPCSHTLQDKIDIFNQVKKVGIRDMMVASFSHRYQVDDEFIKYLKETEEDFGRFFAFSEIANDISNGAYNTHSIPIQLEKNQQYGIPNPFFEVDLANSKIQWEDKFTTEAMCHRLYELIKFTYKNISRTARVVVNFRDFPIVMKKAPERLYNLVKFLSRLPSKYRPWSLAIEDPTGDAMHDELGRWIRNTRQIMTENGWEDGKLIVHIHQKFDLQTACQLECLISGADGIWAGLSEEGAVAGHASSSLTMINLVRIGNTKVTQIYNCKELKNAARAIFRITTGRDPYPKQLLIGEEVMDIVFEDYGAGEFDQAQFFNEQPTIRISATTATPNIILSKLKYYFGQNPQFSKEIAEKMIIIMHKDLCSNVKRDYNKKVKLIALFARAGGTLSAKMQDGLSDNCDS